MPQAPSALDRTLERGNEIRDRVDDEVGARTEQRVAGRLEAAVALGRRQCLEGLERETHRVARRDPDRERAGGLALTDPNLRIIDLDDT